jgi:hypothetical protein
LYSGTNKCGGPVSVYILSGALDSDASKPMIMWDAYHTLLRTESLVTGRLVAH